MTTENIIFLDMDGPLMPGKQWWHPNNSALRREYAGDPAWFKKINEHPDFCERVTLDAVACEYFNIWARMGNAKVVVASNWANWLSKEQLLTIFNSNNMDFELHEDWKTPKKFTSDRVHEIGAWMDNYPECNGLIVDDDADLRKYAKWFMRDDSEPCQGDKEDYWFSRATLISPDYSDGLTIKMFSDGCKALGLDTEIVAEDILGIKRLTEEEKIQWEKDIEMLTNCIM